MQSPLILTNLFSLVHESDRLDWKPFRPGVDIYPIYKDEPTGAAAALLRYQPGASVPEHLHTGFEHIIVLSGSQRDRHGTHKAGTLVINHPDTCHSVHSDDGCIVFIFWQHPVQLLEKI